MKRIAKHLLIMALVVAVFISQVSFAYSAAVDMADETIQTQSRVDNFSKDYTLSGTASVDIVRVAAAQIGKTKAQLEYTEAWCADFVSDCARLAYIETSVIPYTGGVSNMYNGVINGGGYIVSTASEGDLVFYKNSSGYCHVGIMCDSTNSIQGNLGGQVKKIKYSNYRDSDGNACTAIFVRPNYSSVPINPSVVASNIVFPDSLTVGQDCSPTGHIVSSNTVMTWIWIGIFDQSGARVTEASENINTTSYDISKLAGQLNYSSLQEGTYTVEIDVVCGNDYYVPFCKTFTVRSAEKYYLDLNGFLDGINTYGIDGYGCVDIYINGSVYNTNCPDFYEYFPYGTTYEIKNIQSSSGCSYIGVHSGALSGVITGNTSVELAFGTNYYLDLNGYLDRISTGDIHGYGTVDIYINGALRESGWGDFYMTFPYGTTYEIKNIQEVPGHSYMGVYSGSLSGTITGNTIVELKFGTNSTVYFDANGGNTSTSSKAVICGETYGVLPVPSRANYTFNGWYTERDGGLRVTEITTVTAKSEHTLYAHWTADCSAGHSYTAKIITPTCTAKGYTVHTCTRCGDSYSDSYVDALGHAWDEGTVTKWPTEYEEGEMTYTCTRCAQTKTESIPKSAHIHCYSIIETVEATCTEYGYTVGICESCGSRTAEYDIVEPLEHDWDTGTVLIYPTETEPGKKVYTCRRCGEHLVNIMPPYGNHEYGYCLTEIFTDAPGWTNWAHVGVDYVVEHGLFNGTSRTTFSPNSAMTRAMLVTVLWRYAGEPLEGENTFTDVKDDTWYTEAVAWAAHNEIVGGVGDGKFDPNGNITREQMAAILYRYCNSLGIDTAKRADLASFPDGDKVSAWAIDALSWANAEGLITGTQSGSSIYLDPQGNATRAQVATILMRFIENVIG